MPKVSVNILTKDRDELLKKALDSVRAQSFLDYEIVLVDDGSNPPIVPSADVKLIRHPTSKGITASRQEALDASSGEYIAVLDDDDEWTDADKLKKQVEYLDEHHEVVLVGGGIEMPNYKSQITNKSQNSTSKISKFRTQEDRQIRKTMLIRNNFFTSTVMFRKSAAIKAGGFIKDADDFAEDYDLWLRMGNLGKMYNFQQAFAAYRVPHYNKERYKTFLRKQLRLIHREKQNYINYLISALTLKFRLFL